MFIIQVLWALPYTLLGLIIGGIGLIFGGRVQVRGRAIEFYEGGTKWLIQKMPNGQLTLAFTLGHTILGQTDAALDVARQHETIHVRQYERWGPFMLPVYFAFSIYNLAIGKRFYRDNPFEREAYDNDGGFNLKDLDT